MKKFYFLDLIEEFLKAKKEQKKFIFTNLDLKMYIQYYIPNIKISEKNLTSRISDSLKFLMEKGKISRLKKGFWIIITSEYKKPFFINNLINENMKNEKYIEKFFLDNENKILEEAIGSTVIEGSTIKTKKDFNARSKKDEEKIIIESIKNLSQKTNYSENISVNLIKIFHTKIMSVNDKHYDKNGHFKTEQNFINTGYKPCSPEKTEEELLKWIHFFNKMPENKFDLFSRGVFLHLWFEMIHPFYDGNGRLGRFLLSYYFEKYFNNFFPAKDEKILIGFSNLIRKDRKSYIEALNSASHEELFKFFVEDI